jgi:hypothetical protein
MMEIFNKLHEYYRKKIFKEKHGVSDTQGMEDVSSDFNLEEIVLSGVMNTLKIILKSVVSPLENVHNFV